MPIIERKQATTPTNPPTGYVSWFIDALGTPKVLTSTGILLDFGTGGGGSDALLLGESQITNAADKTFAGALTWEGATQPTTGEITASFNWDNLALISRGMGSFLADGLLPGMEVTWTGFATSPVTSHLTAVSELVVILNDDTFAMLEDNETATVTGVAQAITGGTLPLTSLIGLPVAAAKYQITLDAFGAVSGTFAGATFSFTPTYNHERHIFSITAVNATDPLVITGIVSYVDIVEIVAGDVTTSHEQIRYTGNTITGAGAGLNNTAMATTLFGYQAGPNSEANGVTAMGYNALYVNTGNYPVAMGYRALDGNSGDYCAGIGAVALRSNTGNYCSAVGASALRSNKGSNNIGVGYSAGRVSNGQTFSECSFLGVSTSCPGNAANSTALGYGAVITTDNQIVLGNTSVSSVVLGETQLLTTQQAAIADAVGTDDTSVKLNLLLAALRTHGLIAANA